MVPGTATLTYGTNAGKVSVSFYDGSLPLGIGPGILLTSGNGTPPTTNTMSSYGVAFDGATASGAAVDAELQAVATAAFSGAGQIRDASILTFTLDVTDPSVKAVRFDLVFGSDEYPEWVNSSFVDIAAVIVNGANYALFNGQPDQPLSIIQKNLDLGNFQNNGTGSLPIEYDGVSGLLTIIAPVVQGTNTIKIGVADTGDQVYDSGLWVANVQGVGYTGSGLAQVIDVGAVTQVQTGSGNAVYELTAPNWNGAFTFSSAAPGNKTVVGKPGDAIQAKFDFPLTEFLDSLSYDFTPFNSLTGTNSLTLATPYGQYSLTGASLVLFPDAAYALDTYQGGDTWQAYALYELAFGQPPSTQTLSQWVKAAQEAATFEDLAASFLSAYAPQAGLEEVVAYLYQAVTGAAPQSLDGVLAELTAAGLDTAPKVLAYAAANFADATPILGQPVALDPAVFL